PRHLGLLSLPPGGAGHRSADGEDAEGREDREGAPRGIQGLAENVGCNSHGSTLASDSRPDGCDGSTSCRSSRRALHILERVMSSDASPAALTFLFADLESSTRLWERYPEAMSDAMERHDAILQAAVEHAGGRVVKATGDGLMAVFSSSAAGVSACL